MKYLLAGVILLTVGCGTIQEQTLEYCDTSTTTFIGIPFNRQAECKGVSNSDTGTGINPPITLPQ